MKVGKHRCARSFSLLAASSGQPGLAAGAPMLMLSLSVRGPCSPLETGPNPNDQPVRANQARQHHGATGHSSAPSITSAISVGSKGLSQSRKSGRAANVWYH